MKFVETLKDTVSAVEAADLRVIRALAPHRDKPEVKEAGRLSEIADQPPLIAISAAVLVAGLAIRRAGLARTGARMLAAHLLATGVKSAIKRSIDRTRPDEALDEGYRAEPGDSERHELSSFPSGHTAGAVAVAEAVAREAPALAGPMRLFAVAIALVQLPRAKHFVSDVVVGAAIGWVSERAASGVVDALLAHTPAKAGVQVGEGR